MECKIRCWRIEDAEDIAETLNNKNILDNLRDGIPFPYTVHDAREFIQAMNAADSESTFSFAITVDDKAIGSIGAFRQSNIHSRTAEVGYYIAEPYWGQGIGTSASSCRILEKCGFELEGTLRKNAVKNGVVVDMKMYSILKE